MPKRPSHRERGAALVEAITVISILTLGLSGLAFFRELYVTKLSALRLARASAIAHSMAGCQENVPADWLARDRDKLEVSGPGRDNLTASGSRPSMGPDPGASESDTSSGPTDSNAHRFLSRLPRARGLGHGLLNPIAMAELQARVETPQNPRGAAISSQNVRSRSYVSCGDEVKDDDLEDMLNLLREEFMMFIGGTP